MFFAGLNRNIYQKKMAKFKLKSPIPLEHDEQVAVFDWAKALTPIFWELELLYAIPNGGHRDIRVAARLKKEGVRAGIPDMCLPVSRNDFAALYIELKRVRGGRISEIQKAKHEALRKAGNLVKVCKGANEAIETIGDYLEIG